MAGLVKGEVVVIPFPFSDLSQSKLRPAVVVADLPGYDAILCMITSQAKDPDAIGIEASDFQTGGLPRPTSNIRPNRLFTADSRIIQRKAGLLTIDTMTNVTSAIIAILTR